MSKIGKAALPSRGGPDLTQPRKMPQAVGTPGRLAIFAGLLLGCIATPPPANGAAAVALTVAASWLVNKLSSEDGPGPTGNETSIIRNASLNSVLARAIVRLVQQVSDNPYYCSSENQKSAIERFRDHVADAVKMLLQDPLSEGIGLAELKAEIPSIMLGIQEKDKSLAPELFLSLERLTDVTLPDDMREALISAFDSDFFEAFLAELGQASEESEQLRLAFQVNLHAKSTYIIGSKVDALSEKLDHLRREIRDSGDQQESMYEARAELEALAETLLDSAENDLKRGATRKAHETLVMMAPHISETRPPNLRARYHFELALAEASLGRWQIALEAVSRSCSIAQTDRSMALKLRLWYLLQPTRERLEVLRREAQATPNNKSLAKLVVTLLESDELEAFLTAQPPSVLGDEDFLLRAALSLVSCDKGDTARAFLMANDCTLRTQRLKYWLELIDLLEMLRGLQRRDVKRLLPFESERLRPLAGNASHLLEFLDEEDHPVALMHCISALEQASRYLRGGASYTATVMAFADRTNSVYAKFTAARMLLHEGKDDAARAIFPKTPTEGLVGEPIWITTAHFLFGESNDRLILIAIRDSARSFLTRQDGDAEIELAVRRAYSGATENLSRLGISCREATLPSASLECRALELALQYAEGGSVAAPLLGDIVEYARSAFSAKNWASLRIWQYAIRRAGVTDDYRVLIRKFDWSVASHHLVEALRTVSSLQDEELAIEICLRLYESGYSDLDLSLNLATALYSHTPNKALQIACKAARDFPLERDAQLVLFQIAYSEDRRDLYSLPEPVPAHWLESPPEQMYLIIIALITLGRYSEAESIAFRFYLSNPNNLHAQKGIVFLFLPIIEGIGSDQIVNLKDYNSVSDGCSVDCYDLVSRSVVRHWFVPEHDSVLLSPNHRTGDAARELLFGRRVGETIGRGTLISYRIDAIADWRATIFRDVVAKLSSRIEEPLVIREISLGRGDDFSVLRDLAAERRRQVEFLIDNNPSHPLGGIACILDSDLPAVWQLVLERRKTYPYVHNHFEAELREARKALAAGGLIMVDDTALLNIFLLGLSEKLGRLPQLRIGSFSRRAVKTWSKRSSLLLAYLFAASRVSPRHLCPEAEFGVEQSSFRAFLDNLQETEAFIFPGVSGNERRTYVSTLGRGLCQTISVSANGGMACLCDDGNAKKIAIPGIPTFSTLALVAALGQPESCLTDVYAKSLMLGYGGVPISDASAVKLYERSGWSAEFASDFLLLKTFRELVENDRQQGVGVIGNFLSILFLNCEHLELATRITSKVMSACFARTDSVSLTHLGRFLMNLEAKSLAPISVRHARLCVEGWWSGGSGAVGR